MFRYPNSPLTKKLETHLQKLMDVGRRDNNGVRVWMRICNENTFNRSSDDVSKNLKTENYNSQKIENPKLALNFWRVLLLLRFILLQMIPLLLVPSAFKFVEMQKPKF